MGGGKDGQGREMSDSWESFAARLEKEKGRLNRNNEKRDRDVF
jgi:hypothetical protein